MIKVAILGYTILHGFFFACQHCLSDPSYWMPYWITDEFFGGGVMLWLFAFKKSEKYKVAAFFTFLFSVLREVWDILLRIKEVNTSDTEWTSILFLGLLPIIYYTLFVPNGRLTTFIDKHLKRIKI